MFGNKVNPVDSKSIIDAKGCWEEYTFSRDNGNIIIPIGSTGYIAKKILEEFKADIKSYPYLEDHMNVLEFETDIAKLIMKI